MIQNQSNLENRIRRLVEAQLQRGERAACARAAGHQPPWLTKWIAGDLHATIDEMDAMLSHLGGSLQAAVGTLGEDEREVLQLWARIRDHEAKRHLLVILEGLGSKNRTMFEQAKRRASDLLNRMMRRVS